MPLSKGLDILKGAVMALAAQDKPLPERLDAACAGIQRIQPEKDLPPDLRPAFAELAWRAAAWQAGGFPPEDRGALAAMMVDMLGRFIAFTWQYE